MGLLGEDPKVLLQILDSTPDGLIITNDQGKIVFANQVVQTMFGYSSQEMLDKTVELLIPERFSQSHVGLRQSYSKRPSVRPMNSGQRLFGKRQDSSEFNIDINLSPILTDKGTYIAASIRDITEKVKIEEDLFKAKMAAEAANKAKSEFLANMSHEIRTPMNAIFGFTAILAKKIADPQCQDYLHAIKTSGKTLLTLINDILDLSKIEAGKLELQLAPINLKNIISDIEKTFASDIKAKNLQFQVKIAEDLPTAVLLDDIRIRQVLLNLTGNAVKFTHSGTISISIYVDSEDVSASAVDLSICVADTGIGITEEETSHIFQAFSQSKDQQFAKFGGTGLGLAISQRLVTMMGGAIKVRSQVGKGSEFTVELKCVEISSLRPREDDDADDIALVLKPATILIADDISVNRMLLREFLEEYGLNIIEAVNGQEAVALVRRHRPLCVLMDMKMPILGGFEASELIKNDPDLKKTPIIAVTASVLPEWEHAVLKVCDGFVRKPISKKKLVETMANFLPHDRSPSPPSLIELEPSPRADDQEPVSDLATLQQALEPYSTDFFAKLTHTMLSHEIETVALFFRELAAKHKHQTLAFAAEELLHDIDSFSVEKLPKTIAAVNSAVQKVRNP